MKHRRAFTLLELLVVIGIIAVMVGLVFFSFRSVRAGALRVEAQGALRQMIMAYNSYSADDKMRLMPGYLDSNGLFDYFDTRVLLEDGYLLFDPTDSTHNCTASVCDASSYVWRLAPYLDYDWEAFFVDYQSDGLESVIQSELLRDKEDPDNNVYGPGSATGSELGLSGVPAFGLNSIYVGGDTTHGGSDITQYHPWQNANETIAATRLSEVRNPSKLIVFAPTARAAMSGPGSPYENFVALDFPKGYVELRPPKLFDGDTEILQWSIGKRGELVVDEDASLDPAGLPIARWGKEVIPVANLDGSCSMENMSNLSADMSRWRAFE